MEIEDNLPDEQQPQVDVEENAQPSLSAEQEKQPDSNDVIQPDPLEEQAEPDVEENTQAVLPVGHEPVSVVPQARNRSPRWVQVIAAVLAVACLLGGVLAYASTRHNTPTTSTHSKQTATPTPIPPLAINKWCVVNGPTVDAKAGPLQLSKVVALSANDVWAMEASGSSASFQKLTPGSAFQQSGPANFADQTSFQNGNSSEAPQIPVLAHWNGSIWSTIPTADPTALLNSLKNTAKIQGDVQESMRLRDLAVLADNNIWLVGGASVWQYVPRNIQGLNVLDLAGAASHTVIEHWDGYTWKIVDSPDFPGAQVNSFSLLSGQNTGLASIAAVSANDIWAVGSQNRTQPAPTTGHFFTIFDNNAPLAEHWDGSSWKVMPLPDALAQGALQKIRVISSNDIWSFGVDVSFQITAVPFDPSKLTPGTSTVISSSRMSSTATTLAAHWDGHQWNSINLPSTLSKGSLFDSAAISASDIWAVGRSDNPYVQHWDGNQWSSVDGAMQLSSGGVFTGVYAIDAQNVWLLGQTKESKPLIEHWNGKTWSLVSPTLPSSGSVMSMAVAGNRAWALVTAYSDSPQDGKQPLPLATAFARAINSSAGTVLETNC